MQVVRSLFEAVEFVFEVPDMAFFAFTESTLPKNSNSVSPIASLGSSRVKRGHTQLCFAPSSCSEPYWSYPSPRYCSFPWCDLRLGRRSIPRQRSHDAWRRILEAMWSGLHSHSDQSGRADRRFGRGRRIGPILFLSICLHRPHLIWMTNQHTGGDLFPNSSG
jgi:hypothetical protein